MQVTHPMFMYYYRITAANHIEPTVAVSTVPFEDREGTTEYVTIRFANPKPNKYPEDFTAAEDTQDA